MTGGQLAGLYFLYAIFILIGCSLCMAAAAMGVKFTDEARHLSRLQYLVRVILFLFAGHLATAAVLFGDFPSRIGWGASRGYHGPAGVVLAAAVVLGHYSARRLADARIAKRTLAIMAGLPFIGIVVAFYLVTLPSTADEPSP